MSRGPQRCWESVAEGDYLEGFSIPIDQSRIVLQISGSQDFYPVHYDPDFARDSGHPAVFVNTGFMWACFNRLIFDWIGDDGWLCKFRMEMRKMNRLGDVMTVQGCVKSKYIEESRYYVALDLWAGNERDAITTSSWGLVTLPP